MFIMEFDRLDHETIQSRRLISSPVSGGLASKLISEYAGEPSSAPKTAGINNANVLVLRCKNMFAATAVEFAK